MKAYKLYAKKCEKCGKHGLLLEGDEYALCLGDSHLTKLELIILANPPVETKPVVASPVTKEEVAEWLAKPHVKPTYLNDYTLTKTDLEKLANPAEKTHNTDTLWTNEELANLYNKIS